MTITAFRNVEGSATDDVYAWPYEALVSTLERGTVRHWRPVLFEIRRRPWGSVARSVERFVGYTEDRALSALFSRALEDARESAQERERRAIAERVRSCIERSGLSASEFATLIGTSPSRLSTYQSGKVTPSAALMLRMEEYADEYAERRAPAAPA
jgi:DNA-binding transcriptional regulator YiaG